MYDVKLLYSGTMNLLILLTNFALLAINTYIKSSIEARVKLEVEKYKDDLRKRRISEEKLTRVWNSYREYYAILVQNRLKHNGIVSDVENKRLNLVNLLEEYAPFIPKDIFDAIQSMLESIANGIDVTDKIISLEQHSAIVSLFREFLT